MESQSKRDAPDAHEWASEEEKAEQFEAEINAQWEQWIQFIGTDKMGCLISQPEDFKGEKE